MAEHKYTDEETIKSLECCANADCVNCPRWSEEWYSGMCADFLPSVLDLLKRQKAEVAREIFEEIYETMNSVYASVQHSCVGMNGYNPETMRLLGKLEGVKRLGEKIAELKKKYTA